PFAGATGLITVERGKIITRTVQQFPSNSETISIPIVDHDVPNVFVSVVLYRPPTAEDSVPRYKVGYVELTVSTASRALHVSIQPNTMQAKPGDTVHYDIKVTDAGGNGVKAEVSVAVIDKALLSLQDERGIDGLKAFWFERGLGVMTASSLAVSVNRSNDVIAEPPAGGKGGGGLDNNRLRQDFQNTAYWNPQLQTDANGEASVDVKMPDNLTTWRMDVRAISGGTLVGEGQNELVSTQPLLIRPALPRFLRVGDSVTLRTLVTNATAKSSDVTVKLNAQGVDVTGNLSQTHTVDAGKAVMFEWPATVRVDGTAKITFTAQGTGGLSDAVVQSLPLSLDVTPETTATGGIVTDTTQTEAVFLPQWAILKGGSLDISVQAALTGSMEDELKNLAPTTGEYSERIASRLIATIGVRRAQKTAGANTAGYDAQITTDLAALAGQQKNGGGWGWCALCPQSDPNITGWALIALGEGQRDGVAVDSGVYNRATSYVLNYINRPADVAHPADPNQKAFLLYGLSLAGPATRSTAVSVARSLFEQYRSQLTNWGRAYLVLAINSSGAGMTDPAVSALMNDIAAATIPSANGNHWEDPPIEGSLMTNTATTALVLDAMVHADPSHPLIAQTVRWLVVARGAQGWTTTIERAQAILSLSDYSAETGELAGDFSYEVGLDGSSILSGHYAPGQGTRTDSVSLALAKLRAGTQSLFSFAREVATAGRLYYTMNLKYLTPAKDVEALNRGFAVSHQYSLLDDPSKAVSEAELGDTVRVTVTVVVPADRNYVEVDDLLPAGFEPIDPQLKSTDPALIAQLQADRVAASKLNEGDYYAPWLPWYYSPWDHVDTRDDRVSLYASSLAKG
ncbi:MAG TPA: alpha-2-macroglobulin family protein, partial [Candidatus Saccharimonadales bacterium]|nr:alpha-2-macroglobulin family protein [Candidatus Saccharimonadales bacterium]